MPSQDHLQRMMRGARDLSDGEFVKMIGGSGPSRRELVSIQDLAVELGVSIRTLRRWNKLPGAPKRYKRGRRLMYRRADVQHWQPQGTPRAGDGSD